MKYFTTTLLMLFLTAMATAQETVVHLSNTPGYAEDVYFDFATEQSENVAVDSWEIAFLRTGSFEFGERINEGLGITVYEMSVDPNDWNTVTPNDINANTPIYNNSDTHWELGAFDQGTDPDNPFRFGWGVYNPANHHVEGITTFILEYADGNFKKFMIEDFFNGYTFKYASWNASSSSWGEERQVVLSNNSNSEKLFNYYNLSSNQEVIASPDSENWDLVFQKYVTDIDGTPYPVQGVLQHPNVKVAVSDNPNATRNELEFKEEINTIGYDWKSFDGSGYTVDSDTYYFLQYPNNTVYRLHFLSFEGATTGNFSFGFENVTGQMATEDFALENQIKVFPNPTTEKQVTVSLNQLSEESVLLEIISITGQKIEEQKLHGIGNHVLALDHLNSGLYFLKFRTNTSSLTKKLILN